MNEQLVAQWLKRKARREIAMKALLAIGALGAGLLCLIVTFWVVYGVVWFGSHWFLDLSHAALRWVSFAFIVLLFVGNARTSLEYLSQYRARDRTTVDRAVASEVSNSAKAITNLLFIGPRFITWGVGGLWGAWRLFKVDVPSCSSVLALLMSAGEAVPSSKVAQQLPNIDMGKTTDQLHAIGGVLFLVGPPPALGLGSKLKQEMAGIH